MVTTVPVPGGAERAARWFDLGGGPKFILGLNMESCRRKNGHDLGPNDLEYEYHNRNLRQRYPQAWVNERDPSRRVGNVELLDQDLAAIASTGVSAIRVFVTEDLEGLRFNVTRPSGPVPGAWADWASSMLVQARQVADLGLRGAELRTVRVPGRTGPGQVFHVCGRDDFDTLIGGFGGLEVTHHGGNRSHPTSVLLRNAAELQRRAARVGLRVQWVLCLHYGEGKASWADLFWCGADRGVTPPGYGTPREWVSYLNRPPSTNVDFAGRLPVEAWLFRQLIVDPQSRRSLCQNLIRPFVLAMESSGQPLGYELMNETDIHWQGCRHPWTWWISGTPPGEVVSGRERFVRLDGNELRFGRSPAGSAPANLEVETRFLLGATELRVFVADAAAAVRDALHHAHPSWRRHPNRWRERRLILAGILGTEDAETTHELSLLRPVGPIRDGHEPNAPATSAQPPLSGWLSGSAVTRYSDQTRRRDQQIDEWGVIERDHSGLDAAGLAVGGVRNLPDVRCLVPADPSARPQAAGLRCQRPSAQTPLLHDGRLMLVEAGDSPWHGLYDCREHAAWLEEIVNSAVEGRYAGVFIWHYGNPDQRAGPRRAAVKSLAGVAGNAAGNVGQGVAAGSLEALKYLVEVRPPAGRDLEYVQDRLERREMAVVEDFDHQSRRWRDHDVWFDVGGHSQHAITANGIALRPGAGTLLALTQAYGAHFLRQARR